jgi:hypothetical protein
MDEAQWSLWGLEKKQLILASTGAGAALGLIADAGLGGASLLTGTISGGVVGGISGLGLNWLKEKLPSWLQYSTEKHLLGPVKDSNFAFVILGRALGHAQAMLARSHADRDKLTVRDEPFNRMQSLELKIQVKLLGQCQQLKKKGPQSRAGEELRNWVYGQLTS